MYGVRKNILHDSLRDARGRFHFLVAAGRSRVPHLIRGVLKRKLAAPVFTARPFAATLWRTSASSCVKRSHAQARRKRVLHVNHTGFLRTLNKQSWGGVYKKKTMVDRRGNDVSGVKVSFPREAEQNGFDV